ncbi:hypothetical protein L1049_015215 [Liquidambar formosana]|uniref:Uncharacterized protein n=1 Tax=Liquidambar formosana TaxID=63359 RepID=A0AAP0X6D1_LIQFO
MHRRIGNERHRHQRHRSGQPQVAHDDDDGVVVHVEKREPSDGTAAEDDQEGVDEFEEFGEVEDVGPEEEGAAWRGMIGGEAEQPREERGRRGEGEGGEGAADGHGEGEEEEGEVVDGGDEAEEGGVEGGDGRVGEEEGEGEVGEDGEGEEGRRGGECVGLVPIEVADCWMVHQIVV